MKRFDATYRLASSGSLALMLLVARPAQAQVGASPPAQGAVTSQLPLSGESPQGGAVIVGQAPVAGTTTSAVGSTVGATTNTAGNLTGSLKGLQITQSTNASAEGGSTLSLNSGNLRLESGVTFNLLVSSSTNAGTRQ